MCKSRDTMLPPGMSGLSAAVARYSMRAIFNRLVNKYKEADAAAQVDQVTRYFALSQGGVGYSVLMSFVMACM
jgi:hypothetical protein